MTDLLLHIAPALVFGVLGLLSVLLRFVLGRGGAKWKALQRGLLTACLVAAGASAFGMKWLLSFTCWGCGALVLPIYLLALVAGGLVGAIVAVLDLRREMQRVRKTPAVPSG